MNMGKSLIIKLLLIVVPLSTIIIYIVYAVDRTKNPSSDAMAQGMAGGYTIVFGFIAVGLYLIIYEIGMFIHYLYLSKHRLNTKEDIIFLVSGLLLLIIEYIFFIHAIK